MIFKRNYQNRIWQSPYQLSHSSYTPNENTLHNKLLPCHQNAVHSWYNITGASGTVNVFRNDSRKIKIRFGKILDQTKFKEYLLSFSSKFFLSHLVSEDANVKYIELQLYLLCVCRGGGGRNFIKHRRGKKCIQNLFGKSEGRTSHGRWRQDCEERNIEMNFKEMLW